MSPARRLARTVAKNKSYKQSRTTDMFQYFFSEMWRAKGHPANLNKYSCPGPTKKGHRAVCPSGR